MKKGLLIIALSLFGGFSGAYFFSLVEEKPDPQTLQVSNQASRLEQIYSQPIRTNIVDLNEDFVKASSISTACVVYIRNISERTISTSFFDLFFGESGRVSETVSTGSGVIFSRDGYIVTNNHVVEEAKRIEVIHNKKTFNAILVGADPSSDLAVLKIDGSNLPSIPFGSSRNLMVGEWVLAVGNPFNLTSTVTAGIVSAKGRNINIVKGKFPIESFIQTDAAINPGNSGGALVNRNGELIGINTAITSETGNYVGYSFAVPSNNARKVIEDIMEYGNVQRGILGITGGSLNSEIAKRLGVDETEGVYVNGIEEGSGADKGGIERGDIIKEIDGQKIGKFSDLSGYLGSKHPNDVVQVTLLRDGTQKTISVTLIKLETYQIEALGLEVKNTNKSELKERNLSYGVRVSRVLTNDMKDYNLEGIIILKLNDKIVKNIEDVKSIMNSSDRNNPIEMTFANRNGKISTFIFR